MVWQRVRPLIALSLMLVFLVSSLPSGSAEAEPQIFFSEGFDSLDGWSFEGDAAEGWGLTADRSKRGSALYWGDDKGTATPDDNQIPECFDCTVAVRSPTFSIPAGEPAFLYFWSFANVDTFDGGGLTLLVHAEDVSMPVAGYEVPLIRGGLLRYDLGAYAGQDVSLTFSLYQDWALPWYEGLYLDSILVTDLDVVVSHVMRIASDGPAADVAFTIPEGGTRGTITLLQQGWSRDGAAGQFDLILHDGAPVFAGAFHTKGLIEQNVDLDLLGEDIIEINETSGGRSGLGSSLTLDLGQMAPGDWELVAGLVGMEPTERTTVLTFYVEGPLDAVRATAGGAELAFAFGRDFDASTFYLGASDIPVLMVGGTIQRTAGGPAFGLISMEGEAASYRLGLPDGTRSAFSFHLSDRPGDWRLDVDAWVAGSEWPVFELVSFAPRPDAVSLSDVDGDALPPVGSGAPVDPIPEPTPWPEGYNTTANRTGYVSCGVATGPLQTADLCGEVDANSASRLSFPLANGTTSIDLQVTTEAGRLGQARVCATVLRPIEVDRTVCSDEGRVTLWTAADGEAMTRGDETLEIDLRIARDDGVLLQQQVQVDLETAHWGGSA